MYAEPSPGPRQSVLDHVYEAIDEEALATAIRPQEEGTLYLNMNRRSGPPPAMPEDVHSHVDDDVSQAHSHQRKQDPLYVNLYPGSCQSAVNDVNDEFNEEAASGSSDRQEEDPLYMNILSTSPQAVAEYTASDRDQEATSDNLNSDRQDAIYQNCRPEPKQTEEAHHKDTADTNYVNIFLQENGQLLPESGQGSPRRHHDDVYHDTAVIQSETLDEQGGDQHILNIKLVFKTNKEAKVTDLQTSAEVI